MEDARYVLYSYLKITSASDISNNNLIHSLKR